MKGFPLFLCAVLLLASADLFAQDTQKPRIHSRRSVAGQGATAAIDQGTNTGVSTTRPLRGSILGFQSANLLRAITPFVGALDVESTNRALKARRYPTDYSDQ